MSVLPSHNGQLTLDTFDSGYPKFAALLHVHPAFQNFRRFSRARLRLILLKQDELSSLEASLDLIDVQEQRKLNLGCARQDDNTKRKDLLEVLQQTLTEYDIMIKDYHHVLQLPNAATRDVRSIKNWIDGTGCIARAESEFLEHRDDLSNLAGTSDNAVHFVEVVAEKIAFGISALVQKARILPEVVRPRRSDLTQDENIFIMGPRLRSFSRAVTSFVASGILLVPVIVLVYVKSALWRLVIITIAVLFFLSALSSWTKARTIELVTAGASYAAVLVVFTSYYERLEKGEGYLQPPLQTSQLGHSLTIIPGTSANEQLYFAVELPDFLCPTGTANDVYNSARNTSDVTTFQNSEETMPRFPSDNRLPKIHVDQIAVNTDGFHRLG